MNAEIQYRSHQIHQSHLLSLTPAPAPPTHFLVVYVGAGHALNLTLLRVFFSLALVGVDLRYK